MPSLASFYGIIVYMYFYDEEQHHKPHIHAKYSGKEIVIEIHREELMVNWNLASKGQKINKIEPLK